MWPAMRGFSLPVDSKEVVAFEKDYARGLRRDCILSREQMPGSLPAICIRRLKMPQAVAVEGS